MGFAAVHTAATGEEALQLLSDGLAVRLCSLVNTYPYPYPYPQSVHLPLSQVDLCLIDINLGPGITGVEVLQNHWARVRVRAWVRARVMG